MGQKVNPHGMRVGIIKDWNSKWYAEADFSDNLVEDYNIRKFLKKKLYSAGVSKIDIERASDRVKIIIFTAKPGIVIGKGGAEIEKLKGELAPYVNGTTGCDGIMIARGAQGNPWIFSEMIGKEKNGVTPPRPDKEAIRNMILRHSKLQIQYRGEFAGMREMRKHVAWYTKGLTGAADLRRRVNETETLDELMMLLEEL